MVVVVVSVTGGVGDVGRIKEWRAASDAQWGHGGMICIVGRNTTTTNTTRYHLISLSSVPAITWPGLAWPGDRREGDRQVRSDHIANKIRSDLTSPMSSPVSSLQVRSHKPGDYFVLFCSILLSLTENISILLLHNINICRN